MEHVRLVTIRPSRDPIAASKRLAALVSSWCQQPLPRVPHLAVEADLLPYFMSYADSDVQIDTSGPLPVITAISGPTVPAYRSPMRL